MQRDGQRLMVVMPHPDDECFGCASTMARYSAEGATVSLVTMTRGGAGLWNARAPGDLRALTEVRARELRDAAAELGVDFLEVFDYPDGALERVEEVEPVARDFLATSSASFAATGPRSLLRSVPKAATVIQIIKSSAA